MKKAYWEHQGTRGNYHVWASKDKTWQVTKTATPPDTCAGYHSLEALLKLKGARI